MHSSPNRGAMIVLAYLWPLAIVPLIAEKQDLDVRWHAKHGLVLMVAELLLLAALSLVAGLVSLITLGLGCAVSILVVVCVLCVLIFHLAAILRGLGGSRLTIPGVSVYADRF